MIRLLITGPRQWTDLEALRTGLDRAASLSWQPSERPPVTVVCGGADGFDKMAAREASDRGWEVREHLAVWNPVGRKRDLLAGFRRNQQMIEDGPFSACVAGVMPCIRPVCAYPRPHPTHGTMDCVGRALLAGIRLIPVRPMAA